jgi:hypothetical protein
VVPWQPHCCCRAFRNPGHEARAQGLVAAGCPLGAPEFVKEHAAAAGKVVELIERVLALPLSAQDKQLLLHRSLQLKILHLSRVAHKSDVLDAIRKVEGSIVDGIPQIIKCSDAQVSIAQITLPVRLGGSGVHLMSDRDGAACDAAFLSAAALTRVAVKGGLNCLILSRVPVVLRLRRCGQTCLQGLRHA